jgi:hypothetical protein
VNVTAKERLMSYGDFTAQVLQRGARDVHRSRPSKAMIFEFEGQHWRCLGPEVATMTQELADGYEMAYCLRHYCERCEAATGE